MNIMKISPIGKIVNNGNQVRIELEPRYAAGLKGLEGYSHVQVLWWADGCDNEADRNTLLEKKPYKSGPDEMGVFALHSPERPNPVAVSNAAIAGVDAYEGTLDLHYLDAFDGTPVIDLKPYVPGVDRVETPKTPDWCRHWPKSWEESAAFDWASEFNFQDSPWP